MVKLFHRGNKEAREAVQGVANFSNYAINGLGLLFFKKQSCLLQASLRIIFSLVSPWTGLRKK